MQYSGGVEDILQMKFDRKIIKADLLFKLEVINVSHENFIGTQGKHVSCRERISDDCDSHAPSHIYLSKTL